MKVPQFAFILVCSGPGHPLHLVEFKLTYDLSQYGTDCPLQIADVSIYIFLFSYLFLTDFHFMWVI